jgi:hypothetical protein
LDKDDIIAAVIEYVERKGYIPITKPSFNLRNIPNNIEPDLHELHGATIDVEAAPSKRNPNPFLTSSE